MVQAYHVSNPLRSYLAIRENPIPFLERVVAKAGDFVRIQAFPISYYLVNDPELIRSAMVEKNETLILKGGAARGLSRLIGHGILTNHGREWRESRRSLQPLFNQSAIETYPKIMRERMTESLERWRSEFKGRAFSLSREVLALSFRITCSTLFGSVPSFDEALEFADAIWVLQSDGMVRYATGIDGLSVLPTPLNLRIARAKNTLRRLSEKMDASQPVDEIISILFAGTESPANTVCWAMKLLEDHPSWKEKLSRFNPSSDEDFDILSQVINETMRLYPAGWAFERFASADVTLGGEKIPKGSRILFSPYLLHRNPRYWKDPARFDPMRFTSFAAPEGIPKYAFLPFGAGPRSCIGSRVAWIEMRIMLSMILASCDWEIQGKQDAVGSFKIRFDRPLWAKLRFKA